jgi:hypothetical protein
MQLALESWYIVDEVTHANSQLVVRLVPDHFNSEIVEPVVTISITEPADAKTALQSLTRFQEDFVIDLKLSSTVIELWGEYDDDPTVVKGEAVSFLRSSYSIDQLLGTVRSLEAELNSWQAENVKLRNKANAVEGYVIDLLHRAEAKKSLTTRNPTTEDAQIDVLQRLLNRIRSA